MLLHKAQGPVGLCLKEVVTTHECNIIVGHTEGEAHCYLIGLGDWCMEIGQAFMLFTFSGSMFKFWEKRPHFAFHKRRFITKGCSEVKRELEKEGVDLGIFQKRHSPPTLNLIKLSSLKLRFSCIYLCLGTCINIGLWGMLEHITWIIPWRRILFS